MKFLCFNIWTWLFASLVLSDRGKMRGNLDFSNQFNISEVNEMFNSVKGDFVSHSSYKINGSDVTDILGRIEAISSRILTKKKKRRQRLLVDQEAPTDTTTETPEFQLIFLDMDEKVQHIFCAQIMDKINPILDNNN